MNIRIILWYILLVHFMGSFIFMALGLDNIIGGHLCIGIYIYCSIVYLIGYLICCCLEDIYD